MSKKYRMDLKVRAEQSSVGRTVPFRHIFIRVLQLIICIESIFLNFVKC